MGSLNWNVKRSRAVSSSRKAIMKKRLDMTPRLCVHHMRIFAICHVHVKE